MARKTNTSGKAKQDQEKVADISNSLTSLTTILTGHQQISQTDTLDLSTRGYLISNNRMLLSQSYVEHGILQTFIDLPVDDAFRAGFEIHTSQLDAEEIEDLEVFIEKNHVIQELTQAIKWARLFGGGGILIINDDKPDIPIDIKSLKKDSKIQFRAADMWELYNPNPSKMIEEIEGELIEEPEFYQYYGNRTHSSRVFPIYGKKAPSYIRWRLRGWGMSELERIIAPMNLYLKTESLAFELSDEAKIDVYKIDGFKNSLLTEEGTSRVAKRIQNANIVKNYQNAITMDANDGYEQKQLSFAGIAEIMQQNRLAIACAAKMPLTKLFGISAAGFSSGEDDIENYNSMIEGEVRAKVKYIVVDLLGVCCQVLFGFVPDDLKIKFRPLRILNAKEEEEVKNSQYNRVMSAYQGGLIPDTESKQAINKAHLLPIDIDENIPALPPVGMDELAGSSGSKVTQ